MKVLQITVHLSPNVGGVETHLDDLFNALVSRGWEVFALAYQPLSTKTRWKMLEKQKNLTILRIPWLRGFFEKLVNHPVLEFVYLVPGLFLVTPFVIISYNPQVLHAHGLSAAVAAVFWGKIFKIRTVISLHSIYSFPKNGLYKNFVKVLFENCDTILSLSKKSNEEIRMLGIDQEKLIIFTYWIDLQRFKKISSAKKILGLDKKFVVLFVGRLITEKGVKPLLEAASIWNKEITLIIAGSGLLEEYVLRKIRRMKNVSFAGKIDQAELPVYYSSADCVIVPSVSEEGFGRVIIESLACGTPVIASRRGATKEAMDETVGRFIEVAPESIKENINMIYKNPAALKKLASRARQFAERRYAESNVATIIRAYQS